MKLRNFLIVTFIFLHVLGVGQITTDPKWPTENQSVTITFNSAEEDRLGYYTGDLYAHTGVILEGNSEWQHVIGDWGQNDKQPKLEHKGNGIYELKITPDILQFYNVPKGEKVTKLMFVFRSSDSGKQTNDLVVTVYEEGLVIRITNPTDNGVFEKNSTIALSAESSVSSNLKLFLDETIIAENSGTTISSNYMFSTGGNYLFVAEAESNGETVFDTVKIFIRDEVIEEVKPDKYKQGINYPAEDKSALVLYAPNKEYVLVLGDFNDWQPSNSYQMKKDGDYFWLEISDLEPGKEYAFQYLIDGDIKIADPYTEKILDPWNDPYIPEDVYPNLLSYPLGQTEGIVSVLQTNQEEYNWEIENFQPADKNKLVIYELLVRDFTEDQTFKAVREKLDYLEDLRVNVLELMPVNEFEGNNSWGYNPSFYFAPDKFYGPKDELKKLIDECHKRGIAVVIDMVLNHSYGQSPLVQMYMDNWEITPENPWYNVTSPNPVYSWGYDFNHEAIVVEELVDSVNSFWMNEYKVDGFRFDFTKGFTNTPGDGWAYDAPRIDILKRMTDEIRKRNPDALVILEHLSENREEKELAGHGIFLWGNMHGSYQEAARGNTGGSNLSWGMYSERGWKDANLIAYPESHDEERIMYTLGRSGLSNGDYNIKDKETALDRIELNALFYFPLPGPKMIWQFGERGYDVSINDFGGRTDPKPPYWDYLDDSDRTDLFQVMAKLNELKQTYNEFSTDDYSYSLNGATKWYRMSSEDQHVLAVGNFDVKEQDISVTFPRTGKWYEFFDRDSTEIETVNQTFQLQPGEYRLYSTQRFADPHVITDIKEIKLEARDVSIYPNPATSFVNITSSQPIDHIYIYSNSGSLLKSIESVSKNAVQINLLDYKPGIYFIRIVQDNGTNNSKVIVTR